ncbi:unnamed protein product [Closterium sp. Yama58-4]|nr:unnamed protein product [Closterium sp. Yama58-4]
MAGLVCPVCEGVNLPSLCCDCVDRIQHVQRQHLDRLTCHRDHLKNLLTAALESQGGKHQWEGQRREVEERCESLRKANAMKRAQVSEDRMRLEQLRLQLNSKRSLLAHANAMLAMRRAALAHARAASVGAEGTGILTGDSGAERAAGTAKMGSTGAVGGVEQGGDRTNLQALGNLQKIVKGALIADQQMCLKRLRDIFPFKKVPLPPNPSAATTRSPTPPPTTTTPTTSTVHMPSPSPLLSSSPPPVSSSPPPRFSSSPPLPDPGEFTLSICGLRLPSSDAHIALIPPLELAAAIGCLIRLLELLSKYLSFPLLHVAAFAASSSKVWHRQSYWSLAPPTNPRDVISFSLTPSHSHSQSPSSLDSSSHSPSSPPFSSNLPSSPSASTHSSASTLPGSFLSSSFACNSLFGSWAGIPPPQLQDETGHPMNFFHASAANQQLPPGEIKQVRRGLRLLRRSAACLAAAHAGRFGIARPGDEARGGGGAELDEFAELAMMMSAATRDTRLPFLRNQACDSSFLFTPPTSASAQPAHLKPHHPALSPLAAATSPTAAAEGGAGEGVQVPHENLLGNSLVEDYISTTAAGLVSEWK